MWDFTFYIVILSIDHLLAVDNEELANIPK